MFAVQDVAVAICKKAGCVFLGPAGEGSFKHTFRVERGGVFLALKLFKEPPTERSAREIKAMLRCDHPNVAKLVAVDAIRLQSSVYNYQVSVVTIWFTVTSSRTTSCSGTLRTQPP